MTSCTRSLAPSLASSRATCVLAVPTVMYRAAAISALDMPRPTSLSTSRSRSVLPVISRGLAAGTGLAGELSRRRSEAGRRSGQAQDHVDRRGLPGAVGAEEGHD